MADVRPNRRERKIKKVDSFPLQRLETLMIGRMVIRRKESILNVYRNDPTSRKTEGFYGRKG